MGFSGRKGRALLSLFGLLLTLSGCADAEEAMVSLWATPTATATPTSTPTPTATPTPTVTPTPTPLPPTLIMSLSPEVPQQGQTLLVRVTLDRAAVLNGDFDGQRLTFLYPTPTEAWALVAVPPWSQVGDRALVVEAVAPDGQSTRQSLAVSVQESPFEVQAIDVSSEQADLLAPGLRQAEDHYLATFLQTVSAEPLWDGPFGLPAEGIWSSPFGARRSYQGGPATGYHGGLDIAA
ncbi:MAG: hypothetical protein H0T73_02870, partial [Ardenticatenales bacterium]|nr:hypothetical protein [Ardenticatenales bacterium]